MTLASMKEIVETQVCPIIGAILSNLAFGAPIAALRSAVKIGSLGSLNPTPWAFMLGNTLGWIAYAFISGNIYVFMANVFGLIFSIYLNIGAMKLQYYDEVRKTKPLIQLAVAEECRPEGGGEGDPDASPISDGEVNNTDVNEGMGSFTSHEIKVLFIVITWVFILSITTLTSKSKASMERIVGIAVNINLTLFFGAPLSTISTVLRSRCSSSIHFLTMVMNTTNAFFWCVYSFAIRDYYILLPNGIGFTFGLIQALLYCLFPYELVLASSEGTDQFLADDDIRESVNESEVI